MELIKMKNIKKMVCEAMEKDKLTNIDIYICKSQVNEDIMIKLKQRSNVDINRKRAKIQIESKITMKIN